MPPTKRKQGGMACKAAASAKPTAQLPVDEVDKDAKRTKLDATSKFLKAWAWKREHRPDKERFHRPYIHNMTCNGEPRQLTIKQAKFTKGKEGFASTVWDSSIVCAKYLEKHASAIQGKRCLDLSAGCGLVAVAMAALGGEVTATDLAGNLALLNENCGLNGVKVKVNEHTWGCDVSDLAPPFDLVVACDVMYVSEAVPDLIKSLTQLSNKQTKVLVAHGRNRFAEEVFMSTVKEQFSVKILGEEELDEVYQCDDVTVYELSKL